MKLLAALPLFLFWGQAWTAALPKATSDGGNRAAPAISNAPSLVAPPEGSRNGSSIASTATFSLNAQDSSCPDCDGLTDIASLQWAFLDGSLGPLTYDQTITFYSTGHVHLVSNVANYDDAQGYHFTLACGTRDAPEDVYGYVYIVALEVDLDPFGEAKWYEHFDEWRYDSHVQSEWAYIAAHANTMYCRNAIGYTLDETIALVYQDIEEHGPTIGGLPIIIYN